MTTRRANLRRVFVDASAFIALGLTRDQFHQEALETRERLARAGSTLFTTNFILAEVHALLVSRRGPMAAIGYLRDIDKSAVRILRVTADDEVTARDLLERYSDKSFSLTDALSFLNMEKLEMTTAFSFDDDFAQYGFTTL
jgi:predicted nucleic acid-binding protein